MQMWSRSVRRQTKSAQNSRNLNGRLSFYSLYVGNALQSDAVGGASNMEMDDGVGAPQLLAETD